MSAILIFHSNQLVKHSDTERIKSEGVTDFTITTTGGEVFTDEAARM